MTAVYYLNQDVVLTRRNGDVSAIVIKATACFAAQPACGHIFRQERAGAIFGISEAVMQHVHDCEAGIKADKVSKLKWTHRVIGAELHGVVNRGDIADAFIEGIACLLYTSPSPRDRTRSRMPSSA